MIFWGSPIAFAIFVVCISTQVLSLFLQIWVLLGKHLLLQIVLYGFYFSIAGYAKSDSISKPLNDLLRWLLSRSKLPTQENGGNSSQRKSKVIVHLLMYSIQKQKKNLHKTFFSIFSSGKSATYFYIETHFLARLRLKSSFQGMFFLIHQRRK